MEYVYVVEGIVHYEGSTVLAVFDSPVKAEFFVEKFKKEDHYSSYYNEIEVTKFTLNKAIV